MVVLKSFHTVKTSIVKIILVRPMIAHIIKFKLAQIRIIVVRTVYSLAL